MPTRKTKTAIRSRNNAALANEGGNITRDRQPVDKAGRPASAREVQKRSREAIAAHKAPHDHPDQMTMPPEGKDK